VSLSRTELFSRLGLIRVVDPLTAAAFAQYERKVWQQDLDSSPHGSAWHTSFHASEFPGDDPKACGRLALYKLLNMPAAEPFDPKVRAMGDVGKAIEMLLVEKWAEAGRLLSADNTRAYQTGWADPEVWLTGNADAILLPPFWHKPHLVDVKGKDHEVVMDMLYGRRSFDAKHRNQILTYIGFANEYPLGPVTVCQDTWVQAEAHKYSKGWCRVCRGTDCLVTLDLKPCEDGTLYYVSRARPRTTAEFYFTHDQAFMDKGKAKLREWKHHFVEGTLPPRPKDWKWTEEPCKWCPLKKHVCKPDDKAGVDLLENSHATQFAKRIRPGYSLERTREAVLDRWKGSTGEG
jgi:hypothetical protein